MDVINNPEHTCHYTQGYLIPWHLERRRKKEIKFEKKKVNMMLGEYKFEGDTNDEGLPCGIGRAENDYEVVWGTFLKNIEHGIQI